MKDLFTILVAGILLWWVMSWPDNGWATDLYQDPEGRVWIKVFSF